MTDDDQGRRLHWGPFAVGMTVTLLTAAVLAWAAFALGAHWYRWAVAIVGGFGVAILAASAIAALRRPDA